MRGALARRLLVAALLVSGSAGLSATSIPVSAEASTTKSSLDSYKQVALAAGWSESEWPQLRTVIWRESRGELDAVSPTQDYGLAQINWPAHHKWLRKWGVTSPKRLFDPLLNLKAARHIYRAAIKAGHWGWSPWTSMH